MTSNDPSTISEGAKVGRYALLTRLASGGMANVWLARVEGAGGFQKTVVVKTILPHLAGDPEFVRMFIDEAVLASKIAHQNVVSILDLGETGGSYYIAMEYIAGRTLRHVQRELKRTRRVPPPWLVLRAMASACDGLHHAHMMVDDDGTPMHIVHRDISPENIMVSFTGDTKVLDFGIAKASNAASRTRAGVLKGKHAYMAPEQIEGAMDGGKPDPRIDVYSAGVVLYELLTGRRPFRADNELALLRLILDTTPKTPDSFCSWVPEPLSMLVMTAMARDPNARFQSALELRDAIEAYFRSTGSFPTRGHVANYLRGLFGELAPEPGGVVRQQSTPSRRDNQTTDPWENTGDLVSPLTIDLSMVLCSDEDGPDSQPMSSLSPHGLLRPLDPPPPPEPPMAVRGLGEVKKDSSEEDDSWGMVSDPVEPVEIPKPTTSGGSAPPLPCTWRPPPSAEYSKEEGAAASQSQDAVREPTCEALDENSETGMHMWDLLTQRAREEKLVEDAEPIEGATEVVQPSAAPSDDESDTGAHAWDRVVERIRSTTTSVEQETEPQTQPKQASDYFDEGLMCWRNKDFKGTLVCWTRALELDPENRRYESNLRKLKRQMSEDHER